MLFSLGGEIDLSSVCSNESDKMILRNIVYTIWATNKHAGGDAVNCYMGHNVKRIENRGYIILAFFGKGYRIALQDMQLIMDVCPLRVDSIFVREPLEDDFSIDAQASSSSNKQKQQQQQALSDRKQVSGVMCISVLDINQPVQITESEVVRVKKRSRGILFQSVFGGK